MWIEIDLLLQVGLVVLAHKVIKQGDWHDQGDLSRLVAIDDAQDLLLFIGTKLLFEITEDMLKDINVFGDRGFQAYPFDQQSQVAIKKSLF